MYTVMSDAPVEALTFMGSEMRDGAMNFLIAHGRNCFWLHELGSKL